MKKPCSTVLRIFSVFLITGMSLVSCAGKSGVPVHFVSIPGEISRYNDAGFDNRVPESRVQAGGYIYAVGSRKGKTIRLEPLPLVPGEEFRVSGLQSGTYTMLALYYSPELLDETAADQLPLPGESPDEFWSLVSSSDVAETLLANSGAVALFKDFPVRWIRKPLVEAALVPLSSERFEGPDGAPPRCPATNGLVKKQFFRLEPNGAERIYVMLSNFDGAGIVYAGTVSLYSASGAKLETKTFNRDIPADGPESVMFTLPLDSVSYLYLEYAAEGDRALPLFYF